MLKAIHQVYKELHIPLTQASGNLCHFGFGRRIQRHGKSPHISYIRSNLSGLLNFDRKITLRFASDGYRINRRQGPDVLQLVYWQTPNSIDSCRNQAITTHDSGLAGLGSGGVTGKPDVEKRQLVAELQ